MSTFRVGQRVVCVDDDAYTNPNDVPLIKGRTYTIRATMFFCGCRGPAVDVGLSTHTGTSECPKCNVHRIGRWHAAIRFRHVQEADLTASLASSWKESVPSEQEVRNVPEPQHA